MAAPSPRPHPEGQPDRTCDARRHPGRRGRDHPGRGGRGDRAGDRTRHSAQPRRPGAGRHRPPAAAAGHRARGAHRRPGVQDRAAHGRRHAAAVPRGDGPRARRPHRRQQRRRRGPHLPGLRDPRHPVRRQPADRGERLHVADHGRPQVDEVVPRRRGHPAHARRRLRRLRRVGRLPAGGQRHLLRDRRSPARRHLVAAGASSPSPRRSPAPWRSALRSPPTRAGGRTT